MKKSINKEVKFCNICKLGIDETKEFARFTHFHNKDKIFTEAYYHINCYRERLTGAKKAQELQKRAEGMLNFAGNLMGGNTFEIK